jgi:hypothetical protein
MKKKVGEQVFHDGELTQRSLQLHIQKKGKINRK